MLSTASSSKQSPSSSLHKSRKDPLCIRKGYTQSSRHIVLTSKLSSTLHLPTPPFPRSSTMTNFFEEAAFALLDPTSLSSQVPSSSFSSSFQSFSSLSDTDVSSLGIEILRPRELQIKSSRSVDPIPSTWRQDNADRFEDLPAGFYTTMPSRFNQDACTSSPVNSFSPVLGGGGGIGWNSPASAYSSSGPAATSIASHSFNPHASVVSAADHPSSSGYQSFSQFDGALYHAPYSQTAALSTKSSVESFASSTSDLLQTPRQLWCHPWDELSMSSGHHSIPGQSPAQPPISHPSSRSRMGSPRRDRTLSLKYSMPSLVEEDTYHPSQGMGTLPEYQAIEQRGSVDDVFFFVTDATSQSFEEVSNIPLLLPAASVSGEHNREGNVQAPTFSSQTTFEQVANSYLVNGYEGRQQWTSQLPGLPGHSIEHLDSRDVVAYVHADDPDGARPLTAPTSGSEESNSAPPTVMRKSRSNDPRVRKSHPPSPVGLFTFQEREIPPVVTDNSSASIKEVRQGSLSHQRLPPGDLFAIQPIDEARAGLTIKVQPLTKSNGGPGYFQPHGQFHPGLVPPITPEEQTFPFHTPLNSVPTRTYAYTANMDESCMPQSGFHTPPRTGRTRSANSNGSSVFSSHVERPWRPALPRTVSIGTPSVLQCPPMQRSVSYGHSSSPRGSISGWSDTTRMSVPPFMTSCVPTAIEQRPIVSLPLPKKRNASDSKPKPRRPSSKKTKPPAVTGFACSFINFTQDDAEKLLTGVAPSGSIKRRRHVSRCDDEVVSVAKRSKK